MPSSKPMAKPSAEKVDEALDDSVVDKESLGHRVNGFLYGEFGSWKTATACRTVRQRGLLVATDNGWQSLKNLPSLDGSGLLLDNFEILEYNGLSQLRAIAERSESKYREFDTFVLDTVSQMQEEYLDFINDHVDYGGKFRDPVVLDAEARAEAENIVIPALADYHVVRNKMRPAVKALIKTRQDVWFLAHVREPTAMDAKKIRRPSLTDAVYKVVARECNIMGFCEKNSRDEQATISFESTPVRVAKSQIGPLRDKTFTADEFVNAISEWRM